MATAGRPGRCRPCTRVRFLWQYHGPTSRHGRRGSRPTGGRRRVRSRTWRGAPRSPSGCVTCSRGASGPVVRTHGARGRAFLTWGEVWFIRAGHGPGRHCRGTGSAPRGGRRGVPGWELRSHGVGRALQRTGGSTREHAGDEGGWAVACSRAAITPGRGFSARWPSYESGGRWRSGARRWPAAVCRAVSVSGSVYELQGCSPGGAIVHCGPDGIGNCGGGTGRPGPQRLRR